MKEKIIKYQSNLEILSGLVGGDEPLVSLLYYMKYLVPDWIVDKATRKFYNQDITPSKTDTKIVTKNNRRIICEFLINKDSGNFLKVDTGILKYYAKFKKR